MLRHECSRLKNLVDEWQLDGVKPFEIHQCTLSQPMVVSAGSEAHVSFRLITTDGTVVPIGDTHVPNAPTGIYDKAVAFVFTDAFGMKEGFGGAIGKLS